MAVYFDYPIHPPHDDSVNHAIAWHKTSPLLAIGSSVNEKGCISFYLDEVRTRNILMLQITKYDILLC